MLNDKMNALIEEVCGELAEKRRLQNHTGNATFRTDLIDAVFNLTEQQLREGLRYEIDVASYQAKRIPCREPLAFS